MEINFDLAKMSILISGKLESWLQVFVKMLPNLVLAIFVVTTFYLAAKLARKVCENLLGRISENRTVNNLIATILLATINILGLFAALSILQLDKTVTSLLAGAGVLGLALGFAFQEIASNFISGILIAFRKPYKTGDIVKVDDYMGQVSHINLRTTNITTFQGLEVIVPNKDMFTKPLTNYTSTPYRRIDIEIGVSYNDDLESVEEIVKEALDPIKLRLTEKPIEVFFKEFGNSSINFDVRFWVNYSNHVNYLKSRHQAVIEIKKAFDNKGITIPFPIRTLDFNPQDWPTSPN